MSKKNYFLDSSNKNQLILSHPYPSSYSQSEELEPKEQFYFQTFEVHDKTKKKERKKFRTNQMKNIMNELFEKQSSTVQNQKDLMSWQREEIIDKFVERQQFKARQNKILKQMQQFCRFGCIRQNFH